MAKLEGDWWKTTNVKSAECFLAFWRIRLEVIV